MWRSFNFHCDLERRLISVSFAVLARSSICLSELSLRYLVCWRCGRSRSLTIRQNVQLGIACKQDRPMAIFCRFPPSIFVQPQQFLRRFVVAVAVVLRTSRSWGAADPRQFVGRLPFDLPERHSCALRSTAKFRQSVRDGALIPHSSDRKGVLSCNSRRGLE